MKIIAQNKKISFDFEISESFEAGIILKGHEVKSLREGNVNIRSAYASVRGDEIFMCGVSIARFEKTQDNIDEKRDRKLLLHKKEIGKIDISLKTKGITCMVRKLYFKKGLAKAEVVLARGRKKYDKRRLLKERAMDKEAKNAIKVSSKM